VAVVLERSQIVDARVAWLTVDGTDADSVVRSLLKGLKFDVLMLSGISFAGFNVVDISLLARRLRKPVIAITGEKPNNASVKKALKAHFPDWNERWRKVLAAGRLHSLIIHGYASRVYFEIMGSSPAFARTVIRSNSLISRLPEPIRVAGIVARGLSALEAIRET